MTGAPLLLDRCAVAAAVVLTCVLFTPTADDPVNIVKLTALLLVALGLLVVGITRVLKRREVVIPISPAGVAVVVLGLAFVVSALSAPVRNTAVLGAYGRNSGLLAYLAALLICAVALRALGRPGTRVLVAGVVVAGLFTATYGLMQRIGWDLVPWTNPFNPIIAALGNPNFASGYLGIAGTVAAGGALDRGWARAWRVIAAATAVLCLVTAALSASVQGPIALAAGLSIIAGAWLLDRRGRTRTAGLGALAAAVVAGVGVLTVGVLAQAGPAASLFTDIGSRARGYYWEAALTMFSDAPLLGVGLEHYGYHYRSARSTQSLTALAGNDFADAAHSVPLQMLAQGGLVLGLAYFAFVLATAVAVVRGLLRLRGDERMLLAAVAGGWAAYQVQSFVSIDQVPLIVLHFALAGAAVAAADGAGLRTFRLPGAPTPRRASPNDAGARRRARAGSVVVRERQMTGADRAGVGIVALVAAFGAYQAMAPLRASIAVDKGDEQADLGRGDDSLALYEQATDLVPGQVTYRLRTAGLLDVVQPPQPERALAAYESAVESDPYSLLAIRGLARAVEGSDVERSRELHRRAVELSPYDDAVVVAAAQFELRHDGAERARALLERASSALPTSASVWTQLGVAHAQLGDAAEARGAYRRALAIAPGDALAEQGLASLGG